MSRIFGVFSSGFQFWYIILPVCPNILNIANWTAWKKGFITYLYNKKNNYNKGPSINNVTHLGKGRSAKIWHYSISQFSKMGDKGAPQKMGDIIYGWPLILDKFVGIQWVNNILKAPVCNAQQKIFVRHVSRGENMTWIFLSVCFHEFFVSVI